MGFHELPDLRRPPKADDVSLDHRTSFDHPPSKCLRDVFVERRGDYSVAVYPDAAEAVICHRPPAVARSDIPDDGPSRDDLPEFDEVDPEQREKDNWERSTRRAFSESRRYFVANRLRYMWVLTFTGDGLHGPHGRKECMRQVALFIRRFHTAFGTMPYWASPELHPGGHGWHVNLFIPKRLPHGRVQALWAERSTGAEGVATGMVHVSDKTQDPRVIRLGLSFVEALRLGALYGCKYAAKDWSPEQILPGEHRFISGRGFKPRKIQAHAITERGGIELATEMYGCQADHTWRSSECEDWDGPDVTCLRWNKPLAGSYGDG